MSSGRRSKSRRHSISRSRSRSSSRSRSRSRSLSRRRSHSQTRSHSRYKNKKNNPRWFQHDNRVKKCLTSNHNNENKLDWWQQMAKQKSDDCISDYNHKNNNKKSETKMSSTAIVNECIINNAIYNRRMDAMQKRYAENKLIEMGINPFINENVVLMTDHLNTNKSKAIGTIHRNYNNNRNKNVSEKYNQKYSSLFTAQSVSKNKINERIDFSLHPQSNNINVNDSKDNENCDGQIDEINGEYKNWLTVKCNDIKESVKICNNDQNSLFQSIFNEEENDTDEENV